MRALAVVGLVLLTPIASAASILFTLESAAPAEAEGDAVVALQAPQGFWIGTGGADATFLMTSGSLEVHSWRRANSPVSSRSLEDPATERIDLSTTTMTLRIAPDDDGGFTLVADANATLRGRASGASLPQWSATDTRQSGTPLGPLPGGPWVAPSVAWSWTAGDVLMGNYSGAQYQVRGFPRLAAPTLALEGAFALEMNDGVLEVDGKSFALGNWSEPPVPDGAAEAGVRRYVRAILIGEGRAEIPLPDHWALGAAKFEMALDGALRFTDATGAIVVDGDAHRIVDENVALHGEHHTRADAETIASGAGFRGEGDAERVAIAGRVVWSAPPSSTPMRAGGPMLALSALLLVAAKIASVLYTRIRSDTLLQHPTRRAIYDVVVAAPGIHFRALHRAAGCAYGPFLFHTRLLAEGGYLRFVRQGRYLQTFATSAGALSPAAIPNPVARAVYAALSVGERAGPTQVASRAGVSRQLASYHLRRLEKAGLVRRADGAFERMD